MTLNQIENYLKYLTESKDDLEEKTIQLSNFIYKSDLLNVIYEVGMSGENKVLKILHIGAPNQIIDILSHSVSLPLRQIEMDLIQTPILRRVYQEKKSIYFKKLPELFANLMPSLKHQNTIIPVLKQLGITDVAVMPVDIENYKKEYILAVLGPLNDEQKQFLKKLTQTFTDYFNKK